MTRLFVDYSLESKVSIILDEEDSKYIANVLRMRIGESLVVVDSNSIEYFCNVVEIAKKSVELSIDSSSPNQSEMPVKVTLYQSVSKGERMDLTIQKCTELGVFEIVPVMSERVVAKFKDKDSIGKIDRWQKIALEASRQSQRGCVPKVRMPVDFEDALKEAKDNCDLILFPWEEEEENGLKSLLKSFAGKNIAVFIGPEGGYSSDEAGLAKEHDAHSVTLGPRILRTETAGAAVLSMLIYELEL